MKFDPFTGAPLDVGASKSGDKIAAPVPSMAEEERAVMALAPLAQEIADFVKARIPAGTDFGVILLTPREHVDGLGQGRVLAITSDRRKVAFGAAQWARDVLERPDRPERVIDR